MRVGVACPALFYGQDGNLKMLCKADDCCVARQKQLQTFGTIWEKRFETPGTSSFGLMPALLAFSFGLLCYSYNKSALCFCSFLVSCASFSFLAPPFFFYRDNTFLISFLELGHFNVGVLGFFLVFNMHSRLVLFVSSPDIGFLLGHVACHACSFLAC